jgi:hypothetical protein
MQFLHSYLAHGNAVRTQSWNYRIGRSTAYKIIPEVCEAIWAALHATYLAEKNQEQWAKVAEDFYVKWQFPQLCWSSRWKAHKNTLSSQLWIRMLQL